MVKKLYPAILIPCARYSLESLMGSMKCHRKNMTPLAQANEALHYFQGKIENNLTSNKWLYLKVSTHDSAKFDSAIAHAW